MHARYALQSSESSHAAEAAMHSALESGACNMHAMQLSDQEYVVPQNTFVPYA